MDEGGVTSFPGIHACDQVVRRKALKHDAGSLVKGESVGNPDGFVRGESNPWGVASHVPGPGNPIAHRKLCYLSAHTGYYPGPL